MENSPRCTRIRSTIIVTFGVLTSQPTRGIASTRKLGPVRDQVIGGWQAFIGLILQVSDSYLTSSMAIFKHYIALFGGFYDPGIRSTSRSLVFQIQANTCFSAQYLNDLWIFDTQEYRWRQVEFRDTDSRPSSVICLHSIFMYSTISVHEVVFHFSLPLTGLFCTVRSKFFNVFGHS